MANWAKIKAAEKAEKGKRGALDGIPKSAPALVRATRAGEKASAVGFDWPDAKGPRAKIDEELAELDAVIAAGDRAEMQKELGDVLLAVANLARKLGLDPRARCAARPIASPIASRTSRKLYARRGARSRTRRRKSRTACGTPRRLSVEGDLSRASRYSVARMRRQRRGPDVVRLDAAEA